MSDLPTPDTSNYDGTFDNESTYWMLADPLLNDQAMQKWVLPVPDGILQARDELIDTRLQAITDAWNNPKMVTGEQAIPLVAAGLREAVRIAIPDLAKAVVAALTEENET